MNTLQPKKKKACGGVNFFLWTSFLIGSPGVKQQAG
jgi:hypothetical protein